jgi:hypothetical protein
VKASPPNPFASRAPSSIIPIKRKDKDPASHVNNFIASDPPSQEPSAAPSQEPSPAKELSSSHPFEAPVKFSSGFLSSEVAGTNAELPASMVDFYPDLSERVVPIPSTAQVKKRVRIRLNSVKIGKK